ncbi:cobalt ABC transporter, permease protein CbiQ [Longilinea arvoryzae]|uniref:Cobalt ABC transporter, permease protein CbiQ n=1 Tax=Longilinea arvoryzae TaxID=360412 RepID=A0A0S7BA88_9CHLR|nr:cobalt ECF transporter T component CbiQ [Longilinea arvoryzae]GAP14334.1 cobalt ABC transporter, permease protein CbiQ [Longilinea arvoryzae]
MRELYEPNRSSIHQLDARVKVIFTLALIIALNLTPPGAWPAYILFLTLTLSLAVYSRLGVQFVLKRALLAAPFALAAIPLIFTGPAPVVPWSITPDLRILYSPAGGVRFASIAIKSWISVQAAVLLAATTRFPDLLAALQQLRVPKIFVAIIGLMWRYLFIIVEEVNRTLRARRSRSANAPMPHRSGGPLLWRARVTGNMAGSLFLRSIERSDRVYAAMLSRGYNGELPPAEARTLSARDRALLLTGIFGLMILWLLGLLTGG